jgi:phosphatidylglycerophosphate synthase
MRKIPREYENPIDNINLDLAEFMCPYFKDLNLTPNDLTTISFIFGLLAVYFLSTYKMFLFGITLYISYLFDCFDGHYARKYNMTTNFGDIYDHFKDVIVIVLLIYVCFYRYNVNSKIRNIFISILIISTILTISALGCQEHIYNKNESQSLTLTRLFSPPNCKENIHYTKMFGCGTFYVIFILLCIFLNYHKKSQI